MYSRISWEATSWPDADRCPAWPWPVDAAETRFIGKHDPQVTASPGGSPLGFPHSIWKAIFLKLSRDVALGVKRTRHQLAPAVPGQKIIDCALAGSCPMAFS